MVDDSHPDLSYIGAWIQNTDMYVGGDLWCNGTSFQNGTHRTSTAGDSMTFVYTGTVFSLLVRSSFRSQRLGTNVSVYGLFHWATVGTIVLSYTIDDGQTSEVLFSSNDEQNYTDQPNFLLVSSGELAAGNHKLTVNLSACHDQTLIIDYILYEPSFSSLATQPNLTVITPSIPSSSTTTLSATTSPTTTSSSSVYASPSSNLSVAAKSQNTGAIAGGVVGGIAALSVLLILFFWRRRTPKHITITELHERPTPLCE